MRLLRRIIFFAALMLSSVSAAGAIIDSIEWMAARADVVLTGAIINIRRETLTTVAVEVQVTRTLKGTSGRHITFIYPIFEDPQGRASGGWHGEQLFFLLRGVDIPPDRRNDPAAWERLTLVMREVNVLSLDNLKRSPAISCMFGALTDIDEITTAIRAVARLAGLRCIGTRSGSNAADSSRRPLETAVPAIHDAHAALVGFDQEPAPPEDAGNDGLHDQTARRRHVGARPSSELELRDHIVLDA